MRARWAVLIGGLILAAACAEAQERQEESATGSQGSESQQTRRIEPITVTATRVETPVEQVTATVSVIPGEEIESKHYFSIGDALRSIPGVDVQQSGSPGKLTSIRIRGASTQQVQILIDGARVKSPASGTFDLSSVSPDLIERIEIVRGPQSTLYGADAIGGVVNIITKRGSGDPTGFLSVEGGTYSTHRERLEVWGSWKLLDYAAFGSLAGSEGSLDNDDFRQRAFGGRLGATLPLGLRLSLSGRYTKTESDVPIDTTAPQVILDPDSQQQEEMRTLTFQVEQKALPWWEHRLAVRGYWSNLGFQDPETPGTTDFGDTRSQIDTIRREIEWVHVLRPVKWNTLTLGGEYRHEEGKESFLAFGTSSRLNKRLFTRSLFAQDEITLLDRLIVNGGLRYDDNSVFGEKTTGRASAALLIRETGTRLRGGWGQGFRAPSINDLFFPSFGNPDLEPEESESWEVGADQRFWNDRLRLSATYFHNDFDNLIQFVFAGGQFLPQNVARARTEGVEASIEADLLPWLTAYVNYTYTDSKDLTTGRPLRRIPSNRWSLGATAEPTPKTMLFVQAYVVSSQFEGEPVSRNDGYVRVDVGGSYRIAERRGPWPGVEAYLRADNVFNERYSEVKGFQALGTLLIVGLKARY
jgi:vitamin B12 transporter